MRESIYSVKIYEEKLDDCELADDRPPLFRP